MCSSVARASGKESPSFSYGENVKRATVHHKLMCGPG